MRRLLSLLLMFGLGHGDVASAQHLNLGSDVIAASKMIDLAEIPPGVALVQAAGLALAEKAVEDELNRQGAHLADLISEALIDGRLGYLVKVRLYADEFGVIQIPGGELLHPIGAGVDPVDSLAEYLRQGILAPGIIDPKLRDQSFYFWFRRADNGRGLVANTIPSEFRARLHELAAAEKSRRQLLGSWTAPLANDRIDTIARAQYWLEVQRERAQLISDANVRTEAAALTMQMSAIQAECNGLYKRFQELRVEMARAAEQQRILSQIQGVTTLIGAATKTGELISAKDKSPVSAQGTGDGNENSAAATALETRIRITNEEFEIVQKRLEIRILEMRGLDTKLEEIFKTNKIPIPKRDWAPPVLNPR